MDLFKLDTEKSNQNSKNFSSMSIRESVELMNIEDRNAVKCIESQYDRISEIIKYTSKALSNKNRIIYIGAGTSGRLGVLDAVECPPTFGVDYNTVVGLIAGGDEAFVKAKEGAEDSEEEAIKDLKNINFNKNDVLIGIASSGRTPYAIGGLKYAKRIGAKAFSIVCTYNSIMKKYSDITVEAVPGPEVLTGSTRLKAGTATKLILNMISTISMKEIGKIYKNYMVDLKLSNNKLQQRGINILREVTDCSLDVAKSILEKSKGNVKIGIIMILLDLDYEKAVEKLNKNKGILENIISK